MSMVDTVKLLEQRTQKAASLISILRKEKADLAGKLQEAEARPSVDPATLQKLEEAEAKNAILEGELARLREQYEELQASYSLVKTHNEELEEYVEKFQTSNKLIEESINSAMANLTSIEGLDEIPLEVGGAGDIAAAEEYTSGGALSEDVISDDSLLETPSDEIL